MISVNTDEIIKRLKDSKADALYLMKSDGTIKYCVIPCDKVCREKIEAAANNLFCSGYPEKYDEEIREELGDLYDEFRGGVTKT